MTLPELRQMMRPESGLLWSPWFRIIVDKFLVHWWADLQVRERPKGRGVDGRGVGGRAGERPRGRVVGERAGDGEAQGERPRGRGVDGRAGEGEAQAGRRTSMGEPRRGIGKQPPLHIPQPTPVYVVAVTPLASVTPAAHADN